ncbi:uncharacterized protein LOC123689879 [Pieris rapae]|uniref:uncharacterized protein LOC123689879 n=1 Tax=Pieris rapae TaxID=64459 RepID=UPI001E27D246|nr:uncharacterized protein LOC123689879 [Pieris rapae]
METAVCQQFLNVFQDYLNLCQFENWPNNDTSCTEIKNAFLITIHIEKCLDRLQQLSLIDDFLAVLGNSSDKQDFLLKNCLGDPPKFILRKIIASSIKIDVLDSAFKIFLELFSAEKLESYLSDLMLEASSIQILLCNLSVHIPKDKLLALKSKFLLSELYEMEDSQAVVIDMLNNNCTKDVLEMLIISMLNSSIELSNTVNSIVNAFLSFMTIKNSSKKIFWKMLLQTENLLKLCLNHVDIFKKISKALFDCGKVHREKMSAEFFYIDLTYSELIRITKKICNNENLKSEFTVFVFELNEDENFWENILRLP